jgi:hypothetical protein
MARFGVLIVCVLSLSVAACASGRGHRNYKNVMQSELGKSAIDPYAYRNHYRERRLSSRKLANGNLEEEFWDGRGGRCRTFFEIDSITQKIVGWRYEGTEEECWIL